MQAEETMEEYVEPEMIKCIRWPRKEKKRMTKDWGRGYYWDLIKRDVWKDGFMSSILTDIYNKEMRERAQKQRENKLMRIMGGKTITYKKYFKYMKMKKTLDATGKSQAKATKQAKRWFKKNPNRKVIDLKTNEGIREVFREDVI